LQVGLLNVDGYYNSLLSFIDKAVEEGFINPSARHIIVSAPTPRELVKKMEVLLVFILVLDRPDAWEAMVFDIAVVLTNLITMNLCVSGVLSTT